MNQPFLTLLAATRVQRALTALATMLVPVAFAGKISTEIFVLAAVIICIYAVAGIQNALKDNDYELPAYHKVFSGIIIGIAVLLALIDPIILGALILWIGLGMFYNTGARHILYGDVTVLSITHHTLPTITAAVLLGLAWKTTFMLAGFMFVTFWTIIHLKNLKDTTNDAKRGYKTLTTEKENGTIMTRFFFELSFLVIFTAYFLFDLSPLYLGALLFVLGIKIGITVLLDLNKPAEALNMTRLMAIVFLFGMVIAVTDHTVILWVSGSVALAYLFFLMLEVFQPVDPASSFEEVSS